MPSRFRSRLTFANVTSAIALFVALGGSAFAAASLVGKGGQITGCVDKANGEVRVVRSGKKCAKDETKLAWNQKGPQGKTGNPGALGARGPEGPPGVSGLERVDAESALNSDSAKSLIVECPAGKRALGGGADINQGKAGADPNAVTHIVIDELIPSRAETVPGLFLIKAYEVGDTPDAWSIIGYALCANVS